jgi:hypothetical protein
MEADLPPLPSWLIWSPMVEGTDHTDQETDATGTEPTDQEFDGTDDGFEGSECDRDLLGEGVECVDDADVAIEDLDAGAVVESNVAAASDQPIDRASMLSLLETMIADKCPAIFSRNRQGMRKQDFAEWIECISEFEPAIQFIKSLRLEMLSQCAEKLQTHTRIPYGVLVDAHAKLKVLLVLAYAMDAITEDGQEVIIKWDVPTVNHFFQGCLRAECVRANEDASNKPLVRTIIGNLTKPKRGYAPFLTDKCVSYKWIRRSAGVGPLVEWHMTRQA